MQKLIPNRIRQPLKRRVNNFRQRRFGSKEARVYTGNWGIRYLVYPDSWLDYEVVRHGAYACWLVAHGAEFLDKAATVFDIGANAGLVAVPWLRISSPKAACMPLSPTTPAMRIC